MLLKILIPFQKELQLLIGIHPVILVDMLYSSTYTVG